jgi:hypothetical protein
MRSPCCLLIGLAGLALIPSAARADSPQSPLHLIPAGCDVVLQVPQPKRILDSVKDLEQLQEILKLDAVQEALDGTTSRRLQQLLKYAEKQMGLSVAEMLDVLASEGAVVGGHIPGQDGKPMPAYFAVKGRDPKATRKFFQLALELVEQELQRQDVPARPAKKQHRDVETLSFGKDLHFGIADAVLMGSNTEKGLHEIIDRHLSEGKKSSGGLPSMADDARIHSSHKLLPAEPLVRFWLDMDRARQQPGVKEVYATPRPPEQTVLFGGYFSILAKAKYLAGAIAREKDGFLLTIRMPSGREDMGADRDVNCPADKDPASRPLLEPKNVLFSNSFYLDLSRFWEDRAKLFAPEVVKNLEEADKNTARIPIIGSLKPSKFLTQAGAYHRLVVANQPKAAYSIQPKQNLPSFAYVLEMRDPALGKTLEGTLRGAALFGGGQFSLKLVEEKVNGVELVGYRFPEDKKVPQDVQDIRYNFSPCFAIVGKQFFVCSTIELGKELIELLQKEEKEGAKPETATSRNRFYARGVANILESTQEQLITQAILDQAITREQAKKQVEAGIALLRKGGDVQLSSTYTAKEFHFDVRVKLGQ